MRPGRVEGRGKGGRSRGYVQAGELAIDAAGPGL